MQLLRLAVFLVFTFYNFLSIGGSEATDEQELCALLPIDQVLRSDPHRMSTESTSEQRARLQLDNDQEISELLLKCDSDRTENVPALKALEGDFESAIDATDEQAFAQKLASVLTSDHLAKQGVDVAPILVFAAMRDSLENISDNSENTVPVTKTDLAVQPLNAPAEHSLESSSSASDSEFLNQSVWELVRKQVARDFAPITALLPKEVRDTVSRYVERAIDMASQIVYQLIRQANPLAR